MKCSACGKEVDGGFAYCPHCGNKIGTTEEVTRLKILAVEEKLRSLRREEIGFGVAGGLSMFGGALVGFLAWLATEHGFQTPADFIAIMVVLFVLATVCFFLSHRYSRRREDLVKKLEQGKFE